MSGQLPHSPIPPTNYMCPRCNKPGGKTDSHYVETCRSLTPSSKKQMLPNSPASGPRNQLARQPTRTPPDSPHPSSRHYVCHSCGLAYSAPGGHARKDCPKAKLERGILADLDAEEALSSKADMENPTFCVECKTFYGRSVTHKAGDVCPVDGNLPPYLYVCPGCQQPGGTPRSHWIENCPNSCKLCTNFFQSEEDRNAHSTCPFQKNLSCHVCWWFTGKAVWHALGEGCRSDPRLPCFTYSCKWCGQPGGTYRSHWSRDCYKCTKMLHAADPQVTDCKVLRPRMAGPRKFYTGFGPVQRPGVLYMPPVPMIPEFSQYMMPGYIVGWV
jgi:hypothetical protein